MADDGGVALVTGAGRRLGREIALALGGAGMDVVVHFGSSRSQAESVVAELEAQGRRAWPMQADLSDPEEIDQLFDRVERDIGRLDVLINNAARFDSQPIAETSRAQWDRTMAVNLRAPFLCLQRAASLMQNSEAGGCVVNLADLSGVTPWKGYVAHGISKAGLLFMTRAAARELGPGVRVNAVVPGPILPPPGDDPEAESWRRRGDDLPLGRVGEPAEVCRAILYLVGARYVTGTVLPVDGGEHLTAPAGR